MKILRYILGSIALFGMLSCDDLLEPKITSQFGDEVTYTHDDYAEGLLMNAYVSIANQMDKYNNNFLDAATDNAVTNNFSSTIYSLGSGNQGPNNNALSNWTAAYDCFAHINNFMERCLDTTQVIYSISNEQLDMDQRQRLTGEAFFLRAFWGMELLRVYGGLSSDGDALGYPIVTRFYEQSEKEDALSLPRNTYEECVLQILEDCDSAIVYLPLKYSGSDATFGSLSTGRASGQAAYVLKSRAATYAASPAYQSTSETASNVKVKWERAALLSEEAITLGALPAYKALSFTQVVSPSLTTTPTEYVFRRYHNNNSMETRNLPPAFFGGAYTNPSQNLVNAFSDNTGYPIGHALSNYDPQNPYANRDPRLAATVLCNGAAVESGGRGLEIASYVTEIGRIDTLSQSVDAGGATIYELDTVYITRKGFDAAGNDYRCSRTGYYLRKWISNKADMLKVGEKKNAEHMNPILRVAEVYHNYAEASFEAAGAKGIVPGCSYSAYDIAASIRKSALGLIFDTYLDEAAATPDLFKSLIYNERRVEFAFENHRYFDLRRCMLPLNEDVTGVTATQADDGTVTYVGTAADGSDAIVVEERQFDADKYYYSPLPYAELMKNSNLENNKGW